MLINNKMKYKIIIPVLFIIFFIIYQIKIKKVNIKEKFKKSKKKSLVIILPIRNREHNLKEYLENMIPIFNYQNINYRIFIIEQSKNKRFNKGKINNIGFLEALKENKNYNRILFNDVDNYPLDKNLINYNTKVDKVNHFFGNKKWLGGFFMINKSIFQKVNGYSNNFWGWGGEDNDLQNRLKFYNVNIDRSVFFKRNKERKNIFIKDDYNDRDINKNYKKDIENQKNKYLNSEIKEGLSNCKYKILKKYNMNNDRNITRILVDI